jgi:DNA-binding NtrC family response regulator
VPFAAPDGFVQPLPEPRPPPIPGQAPRFTCCEILLVDDDVGFVDTLGAVLTLAGYTVVAALTYAAALDHLGAHCPDVLITDLQLGEADGWRLVDEARQRRPLLPVLVVTAWPYPPAAPQRGPRIPVFLKPFEAEDLLRSLRSMITMPRQQW